jgi:hypothetical protein
MIPGNSRREIAIERAMEEAEETVMDLCASLSLMQTPLADAFQDGLEDAQIAVRQAGETLEGIQAKLDDAYNVLGRATTPDEPEDER